jgi:hypothetical protein
MLKLVDLPLIRLYARLHLAFPGAARGRQSSSSSSTCPSSTGLSGDVQPFLKSDQTPARTFTLSPLPKCFSDHGCVPQRASPLAHPLAWPRRHREQSSRPTRLLPPLLTLVCREHPCTLEQIRGKRGSNEQIETAPSQTVLPAIPARGGGDLSILVFTARWGRVG